MGVARQYRGNLGQQDNGPVAVSVSLGNEAESAPAAYRLCLPEERARDRGRRRAVGVPKEIGFETKGPTALDQIDLLRAEGPREAPVVDDAGYGASGEFRQGPADRGFPEPVGIPRMATLWPPGFEPRGPARSKGNGRPSTMLRRVELRPLVDALSAARSSPREGGEKVA